MNPKSRNKTHKNSRTQQPDATASFRKRDDAFEEATNPQGPKAKSTRCVEKGGLGYADTDPGLKLNSGSATRTPTYEEMQEKAARLADFDSIEEVTTPDKLRDILHKESEGAKVKNDISGQLPLRVSETTPIKLRNKETIELSFMTPDELHFEGEEPVFRIIEGNGLNPLFFFLCLELEKGKCSIAKEGLPDRFKAFLATWNNDVTQ